MNWQRQTKISDIALNDETKLFTNPENNGHLSIDYTCIETEVGVFKTMEELVGYEVRENEEYEKEEKHILNLNCSIMLMSFKVVLLACFLLLTIFSKIMLLFQLF